MRDIFVYVYFSQREKCLTHHEKANFSCRNSNPETESTVCLEHGNRTLFSKKKLMFDSQKILSYSFGRLLSCSLHLQFRLNRKPMNMCWSLFHSVERRPYLNTEPFEAVQCVRHDIRTVIVAPVCVYILALSIIMHGMLIKDYLKIRIPFREGSLFFAFRNLSQHLHFSSALCRCVRATVS